MHRSPLRLAALLLALPAALAAQGGQVVGVGGRSLLGDRTQWHADIRGNAFGEVTDNAPRTGWAGYGNASLELSVAGAKDPVTGQYPDWAFWTRYAGNNLKETNARGLAFGNLRDLSRLSFDWYRDGLAGWDDPVGQIDPNPNRPINPADWRYKTPVVRLELREQRAGLADRYSELVWEGYYNACSLGPSVDCAQNTTPVNQWVSQQNMQNDNFWYVQGDSYGTQGGACTDPFTFWQGGLVAANRNGLFGDGGCLAGASVDVIGISVGLGDQWPLAYHGFVDNVRMGFGSDPLALDANFDRLPRSAVPEPSTYVLTGLGLAAVALVRRRRRVPAVKQDP